MELGPSPPSEAAGDAERHSKIQRHATLVEPIQDLLDREDQFAHVHGYELGAPASGIIGPEQMADRLVWLLREGRDPEAAAAWLDKVFATRAADGIEVMALWGVETQEAFDLAPGMRMVPFLELPPSVVKNWLRTSMRAVQESPLIPIFLKSSPFAVLLREVHIEPFMTVLAPRSGVPRVPDGWRMLDDARLVLTLVEGCAPLPAAQWFQFHDPDPEKANGSSVMAAGGVEIIPFGPRRAELVSDQAGPVVEQFLGLGGPDRERIRVALERLLQSRLRRLLKDKAVELAIAYEALLGRDSDFHRRTGARIARRARDVLGGRNPVAPRKITTTVDALWVIRNALLHEGTLPPSVRMPGRAGNPSEVIKNSDRICSAVLRKVLALGEIPTGL